MARRRTTAAAETVILTAAHEHRGVLWPPETRLELRPDQAQRLYRQGKAQPARPVIPETVPTQRDEGEEPADGGDGA